MKARIMLDNAPLGPDALQIARTAFDSAWQEIAARYDPNAVEAARERLAKLILSLMPDTQRPGRDTGHCRAGNDEGRVALPISPDAGTPPSGELKDRQASPHRPKPMM